MTSSVFFISMVVMILIMGAVTVLAIISSLKSGTLLSRRLRDLSGALLSYMILGAIQYFFLEYQNNTQADKLFTCLADISYYLFLICWMKVIMTVSENEKILRPRTMYIVTAVYGLFVEAVILFAATYSRSGAFSVEAAFWQAALVAANALYVLWLILVNLRYLYFTYKEWNRRSGMLAVLLASGSLLAYLVWTLVTDYRLVTFDAKMSEIMLIDPLVVACAALGGWIIYIFFKKDPLALFVNEEALKREKKLKEFIEENNLTRREAEVLELVCDGMNNPAIAEILCISGNTVKRHLNNIFQKTGAANRYELISFVLDK